MRPRCELVARLFAGTLSAVALTLGGCGSPAPPTASEASEATREAATEAAQRAAATAPAAPASSTPAGTPSPGLAGRSRELQNPDEATMALLYLDLAGIPLRIDDWVEQDPAVQYAPGAQKAGLRAARKAELQGAAQGVHDVGALRLTLDARLSPYDPDYGEFTVRALAPSSVIQYAALGQKVEVSFGNARTAQVWKVPAAEAQAIQDRISRYHSVSLDVLLRITGVRPAPGGGTITADVVEYEMRDGQSGATIARVQIPGSRT